MRNQTESSPHLDDRKRLRKIRHQTETGTRQPIAKAQTDTLKQPQIPRRRFQEDRITIALFLFVASCTLLPMSLLILTG